MAKKFIRDIVIGEALENESFRLDAISEVTANEIKAQLSDRSGVITASFPKTVLADYKVNEHFGEVLSISAVVLVEDGNPLLVIKSFTASNDFLPAEVYAGINEEKKQEYFSLIKEAITKFKHTGYKTLVEHCLTDENLEKLARLPATHNYYGTYVGGALAATVSVTYMLMSSMAAYVHKGNGITTRMPDWDLMLCATLLHAYGRIDYCSDIDPFKKSARGVAMNYMSTLQHAIETVIIKDGIGLSEQEIANLLNILSVSVTTKTDTRAVSKEGAIVRYVLRLYAECDAIDYQLANHTPEEGEEYFYSRRLSRYLMNEVK